ncbi:MAG: Zn-dependent hydrolase [Chloroflexi bacterium]|nr:MAG: Zn-dependent hydrolase [Chloroflexota bacterium]TMG63961.1 MAG: Zn-dependent hydrolase [Chloroflexota bacterium]
MIDRKRLGRRMTELARIGGDGTAVSRLGLSADEQRARDLVGGWLSAKGAIVRRDAAANVFARFGDEGETILVGSHLDSVPEGGRFDGALGVLCAVEALESLVEAKTKLRRPVEVVAWADEEGARFGVGLFGSTAAFGRLGRGVGDRRDRDGVSIADALRALGERGDPAAARRDPTELAAYLELHIEQGPRLDAAGLPLGVVSDIVGIYHARVTIRGRADHAGATVMTARADALAAASEIVLAVERIARGRSDSVGTVGEIRVRPGAKNVVPGECVFSLDLRAARDHDGLVREVLASVTSIASARAVEASVDELARVPVTALDPRIRDVLKRATRSVGVDAPELVSGAGHDAQNPALSGVPTGMIFVRSTGGSHTPREFASVDDAALGAQALANAIKELAS